MLSIYGLDKEHYMFILFFYRCKVMNYMGYDKAFIYFRSTLVKNFYTKVYKCFTH